MFQKDFILRMIQEMVELIGIILGLIERGRYEEAMEVTDEVLRERFDLDADWLLETTDKELQLLMLKDGVLDEEKWKYTAKLLHLKGMIYELIDDDAAYFRAKKRELLVLLVLYNHQRGTFSFELIHNIETHLVILTDHLLSPTMVFQLFHYYQDQLRFDRAENMLFELVERAEDKNDFRALGEQFYKSLFHKKREALKAGNLPFEEVKQGYEDFERLFLD